MSLYCYQSKEYNDLDVVVKNEYNLLMNDIQNIWKVIPLNKKKELSSQIIKMQYLASNNVFTDNELLKWNHAADLFFNSDLESCFKITLEQLFQIHNSFLNLGNAQLRSSEFKMDTIEFVHSSNLEFHLESVFKNASNQSDTLMLAGQLGHDLLTIHPFYEGNGRSVRLFISFFLISQGYPPMTIENNYDFLIASSISGPIQNINHVMLLTIEAIEKTLSFLK